MRAWQIQHHGGPEVLKRIELSKPVPKPGEALIRVEAVGLNRLDLWVRNGVPGHHFPLPLIPGCDISGIIESFGPGSLRSVGSEKIGTPVILNAGVSCGHCESCLSGFDPLCKSYGILGETQNGGCTEFVTVPFANLIARPKNLSASQGASLPITFLTAWTLLVRKAQIKPGETVLIQAGGSGVSVAAIQIAKLFGATVITTVGSEDKKAKALALGADYCILYKKVNFREEVKGILQKIGKKGCEVVIDHVGAETFNESIKCLAWGGRLATCGATSGSQIEIDLKQIFFKNISILGTTMGSKGDLIRIVQLLAEGKLKTVIDREYSMDELPLAYERLEKREVFGKVIVKAG